MPDGPAAAGTGLAPAASAYDAWRARRWRRTRLGLGLTALGLLLAWIPFVSVLAALFLSFGSTFFFLGARAVGRRHETLVALAFLALAIGGVVITLLVGAFLLRAYDAARVGQAMVVLREPANLMVWGTLPATVAIAAGFGLQVAALVPRGHHKRLVLLCTVLATTAALATWLSASDVEALGNAPVRTGTMLDFVFRLSAYRIAEAPAYVGLAFLHILVYWDTTPRVFGNAPVPVPPIAEKG